jgi:hypothetical protein
MGCSAYTEDMRKLRKVALSQVYLIIMRAVELLAIIADWHFMGLTT